MKLVTKFGIDGRGRAKAEVHSVRDLAVSGNLTIQLAVNFGR